MFPNWTGWKTVKLVLSVIGTAAGSVAAAHQGSTIGNVATIVSTLDTALLGVVVILSGSNMGPAMAPKGDGK